MSTDEIIKNLKTTIKKGGNPVIIKSLEKKIEDLKKEQISKR